MTECYVAAIELLVMGYICSSALQVLVVTFTWLFVAPTLTCWLWRLAFVRSFQQVRLPMLCASLNDVRPSMYNVYGMDLMH